MSLAALVKLLAGKRVVALTGAGVSTESGIPDYRSPEALARPRKPIQGPEFVRSEALRRRYWARATAGWERIRDARPGPAHRALASLEERGVLTGIITQNVDRLHRVAGSQRVIELHGALADVVCLECRALEDRDSLQARIRAANPEWEGSARSAPDGDAELADDLVTSFVVPTCLHCGGALKPDVVFFGHNVARPVVDAAFAEVEAAEALLICGTSLTVYSGYRFLRRAVERGMAIVIVNRGPVRGEEHATLKLEESTGASLTMLAERL